MPLLEMVVENGADEWGEPLMILPPTDDVPITVEVLADPEDWQLTKLENGFLKEIGETPATQEKQEKLRGKYSRNTDCHTDMRCHGCSTIHSFSTGHIIAQ